MEITGSNCGGSKHVLIMNSIMLKRSWSHEEEENKIINYINHFESISS